jgi:predicted transposase YbfD/YdcC
LRLLDLNRCIVTVDAMGCQTAIAKQIVQQGTNYVLAVKENQEQLHREIADTFRYAEAAGWRGVPHAHTHTVQGAHGRIETRHSWLIDDPEVLAYLNPKGIWQALSAIGMTLTERHTGTAAHERRSLHPERQAIR